MPREIIPPRHADDDTGPILTASPEMKSPGYSEGQLKENESIEHATDPDTGGADTSDDDEDSGPANMAFSLLRDHRDDMEVELSQKFRGGNDLHPYVQVLSISDLEACVAVENAAFPEDQRASREKIAYRLTVCPFICLGLFSSTNDAPTPQTQALYDAARAPDSTNPGHKSLLLGHVLATLTSASIVTEESVEMPSSFPMHPDFDPNATSSPAVPVLEREPSTSLPDSSLPSADQPNDTPGHHPLGKTIAIHSVAVHPAFQNLGLGKTMLKAYLQRMEGSGIADRAALLAKEKLVGFYIAAFGFEDAGPSQVKFAGGGWKNLTYNFQDSNNW